MCLAAKTRLSFGDPLRIGGLNSDIIGDLLTSRALGKKSGSVIECHETMSKDESCWRKVTKPLDDKPPMHIVDRGSLA